MSTPAANTWENVLTTVLNIPISNRSEVTGQPWLTVVQGGQPGPGGHLISTVTVNATPATPAASVQVYLNPAVYAAGGAWDRFVIPPLQALSSPPDALPLVPRTFHAAQLALASVTTGIGNVSAQLDAIHNNVTAGGTPFQGNTATVAGELFSQLHGVTLSIRNQLSNPSHSDAVGAAGAAATTFLNDIHTAYTTWSGLPEHSPLGALVQALTAVAAPDGNGGNAIPDPQNTPFGDLTTPAAWAFVEQQAKSIWTGLLTGSFGFAGLDLLGNTALSKLASQYTTTTGIVVPVVGPALTQPAQAPVNAGQAQLATLRLAGAPALGGPVPGSVPQTVLAAAGGPVPGSVPQAVLAAAGGPAAGGPVPGGPVPGDVPQSVLAAAGGPVPGSVPQSVLAAAGGPVPGDVPHAVLASGGGGLPAQTIAQGTITPGGAGGPAAVPQQLTALGGAAGGNSGTVPGLIGLPFLVPPGTGQNADPGARRVSAGLNLPGGDGVLAGAIGALPASDAGAPGAGSKMRRAPVAGFSLGGGPHGAVFSQSVVPVVEAKPPGITGTVNMQLTPASADGGGLPVLPGTPPGVTAVAGLPASPPGAQALAGPPGGPPAESSMMLLDGSPGAAMVSGQGAQAGADEPMMLPPGALGGRGRQDQERERLAYLPEDEDYWCTGPPLPGPGRDALDDEAEPDFDDSWLPRAAFSAGDDAAHEPDFDGPRLIVGIGAEALNSEGKQEHMPDWRTR
jgi:hypothetical protein